MESLQETFDLTRDIKFNDYLGTRFENSENDESVTLNQPGLVKRILELSGINSTSEMLKLMKP